jgi:hypothetical protein
MNLMGILVSSLLIGGCQNFVPDHQDPSQFSAPEKRRLYQAANQALADFFTNASPTYTVDEASTEIFPPAVIQITVTKDSKNFTYVSGLPLRGYAAFANTINQALVIDGDGQVLNRIQSISGSTGTLWRAYLGESGTVSATIYSDAIIFSQTDFRVIKPPLFTGPSAYPITWPLVQWDQINPWLNGFLPEGTWLYYGRPLAYITGSHLPLTGNMTQYWYMRLWPLPAFIGNVSYTIKRMPPVLRPNDVTSSRTIPLPDHLEPLLVNLMQRDLINSPYWNAKIDRKGVKDRCVEAERQLNLNIATQRTDSAPRRMGTPAGF